MKEIVITGGITAPSGYLITKALFAAKPSLARSLAYRTCQAWPGGSPQSRYPMRYAVRIHTCDDVPYSIIDISAGEAGGLCYRARD